MNLFSQALQDLEHRNLRRARFTWEGLPTKRVVVDGKSFLNLSSNDYLGMSSHPRVQTAAAEAALKYGAGAGGSRLLGGGLHLHENLENRIQSMRPLGGTLLFNTGFMANLGVIQSLGEVVGPVFSDKLNHASVAEGLRLFPGRFHRYRHGDMAHLEALLQKYLHASGKTDGTRQEGGRPISIMPGMVCSETLFSMDGDFAPLEALLELQSRYGFYLYLDEAHSTGVYPGLVDSALRAGSSLGVTLDKVIIMGTFGKAFGGFGAYVSGPADLIEYLVNTARSFIFSTALPPAVIAGNLAAMDTVASEPWRRERLEEVATLARELFTMEGLPVIAGTSHIVPILAGASERALRLSAKLRSAGFLAPAIRPPTVPAGQARLRLSLNCEMTKEEIRALAKSLSTAWVEMNGDVHA